MRSAATSEDLRLLRMVTGPSTRPYTDEELERVIAHTGDVDLAVTAFQMKPKPTWLNRLLRGRADL